MNLDQQLIKPVNSEHSDAEIAEIFDRLTRSRRSIRGYLPQRVEQSVLEKVFETAAFAPSNCNSQPWDCHVVSGDLRDRISRIFLEETIGQGNNSMDFPYDASYEGIYRKRQVDVAVLLYQALGVERDDKEGRVKA